MSAVEGILLTQVCGQLFVPSGLAFRVQGLGFGVWGLGFRV